VAGISAAHHGVTAGTISCFCKSDNSADAFVLSNNHVFAKTNAGKVGDALLQPGPADNGTQNDSFASLHRYVGLHLDGQTPNRVDAAIGRLRSDISRVPGVCTIGQIAGTERGTEDMVVRKHGRTTGYTEGVITDESYDALVGMDSHAPNVFGRFEDQNRIAAVPPYPSFALGGDSGALVLAKSSSKAVGLYFAGPASGVYGVANQIEDVFAELEIELL